MSEKKYKHKYEKYKKKYHALKRHNFSTEFILPIRDPWLTYIEIGKKTVEGRLGNYNKFKKWINKDVTFFNSKKSIIVHVIDVRCYNTLYEYLDKEGFDKVLPGVNTYQEAVDIYHEFYSDERIKAAGGMCGIVVKVKN
ncbi:ASCH domain protein [Hokovirus HKV1]|uniref:ASCH domain protein n=1 Tax=Hokovirus HKV1 TaxID=1977638 RepID=A0A1V0SG99_9VIRU|nr:ASCH domain protein [Hokovirus HKV1]